MSRFSLLILFASLASASSAVVSTFDADAEGWKTVNIVFNDPTMPTTVNGQENATWVGDDGVPAGSLLRGETTGSGNDWRFFSAPSLFLGDQSGALGTSLTYDTKTDNADGARYPAVILRSGSTFLFAVAAPPQASWTAMSLPLVGASWSTNYQGTDGVSDALLGSVLGSLDGLYIDADWYSLPTERAWLDNVDLRSSPVPEPAALAPLGVGTLAMLARLRRRPAAT